MNKGINLHLLYISCKIVPLLLLFWSIFLSVMLMLVRNTSQQYKYIFNWFFLNTTLTPPHVFKTILSKILKSFFVRGTNISHCHLPSVSFKFCILYFIFQLNSLFQVYWKGLTLYVFKISAFNLDFCEKRIHLNLYIKIEKISRVCTTKARLHSSTLKWEVANL